MSAEELALMGYQPSMGSPNLTQAAANVSPEDLQQFYAMSSGAAPSAPSLTPDQVDPALLAQLMGTPAPQAQMDQVSANQLAMMGVPPPSDPNGFTTGPDQPATAADGSPLNLPPNTGAANTYGNAPAPEQAPASAQPAQPAPGVGPGFYQWAKENYGLERGQPITVQEKLKLMELHNDYQKELLKQQDPEKQLKLQQLQHEISTQGMKDQNLQAQTAESQSKVIQGELAKQNAMDTATGQIAELQSQRDNLQAIASHPALPTMVGAAGQFNPGITDQQRNLKSYFDQIDGQKLIDGINKIKNESAVPGSPLNFRITQQEAMAVKDSVNRLKRSQSPEDYRAAISSYSSILDRAIAAKQAQLARMPGVNQELLKQFSYTPASPSAPTAPSSAPASAPVIKTIPGRGTFQSLGNGQWKQIQ
jgi:hypothetical protein